MEVPFDYQMEAFKHKGSFNEFSIAGDGGLTISRQEDNTSIDLYSDQRSTPLQLNWHINSKINSEDFGAKMQGQLEGVHLKLQKDNNNTKTLDMQVQGSVFMLYGITGPSLLATSWTEAASQLPSWVPSLSELSPKKISPEEHRRWINPLVKMAPDSLRGQLWPHTGAEFLYLGDFHLRNQGGKFSLRGQNLGLHLYHDKPGNLIILGLPSFHISQGRRKVRTKLSNPYLPLRTASPIKGFSIESEGKAKLKPEKEDFPLYLPKVPPPPISPQIKAGLLWLSRRF